MVGLSRLLEPPLIWLVAGGPARGDAARHAPGPPRRGRPGRGWFGVPIESLILPSVAAVACLGAIRLVPFGLWLVPALAVTWLIVGRTLALESRINRGSGQRSTDDDRTAVLVTILLVAFLGFTGVAAMVPGGLVQTGGALPGRATSLVLAAGDALVAGLLGYRAASLRVAHVARDVAVGRADLRGGDRHRRGRASGRWRSRASSARRC